MSRAAVACLAIVPCIVLLLPAFAIATVLVVVSSFVRGLARVLEPRFVPWPELMTFDAALGWKPRPDLDTYYLAEHDDVFRVITDGDGWPGRRRLDDSEIVVIGDSFAFGYGVDAGSGFAEVEPAIGVKAIGAPGYSMVHGVRLMEGLGERLRGKLVVWFIYPENDLQDNLVPEMRRYRAPFVRLDPVSRTWSISDRHVAPERWLCSDLDRRRLFPRMCVPGALADRAYAASEYLLTRAHDSCRLSGATLAVLTIPHPMQLSAAGLARLAALSGQPAACDPDLPDVRLARCCGTLGIPFVAGRAYLSPGDYKRREGIHWNERGHRRIATLLRGFAATVREGTAGTRPADVARQFRRDRTARARIASRRMPPGRPASRHEKST